MSFLIRDFPLEAEDQKLLNCFEAISAFARGTQILTGMPVIMTVVPQRSGVQSLHMHLQ